MLEKYFIHAKKKKDFLNELNAGNILEEAVVFIENTKEIYHKGVYYNCKSVDISGCVTESQVQNIVLQAFDELSTVAFSGSYNDLINKPTIPTIPSTLPNPNSLVIKKNGVQKVSYTGSSSAIADITGDWYGTSSTSASTAAKSVSCSNYTLTSGERIAVKFTYANTASNPTLNVNNKGAKSIYWNGSPLPSSQYWSAGAVIEFLYDGSYYHMLGAVKDKDITNLSTRVQEIEGFFEEGAKLNLSIKSNQGTDSTISAVKATIEYDGQSVQAGSGVIGLPVFTDIKIIFPDVAGYKTPAPLEFTTGALPVVYEVTYETELVNVTVTAWDGTSVVGQIITINGTQYTWDGTTIQHKVPFGTEYKVSGNSKDGYIEPEKTFTASLATRNVTAIYSAMVGSWITLNQTITDPATMLSGDINGEHIQLIRNNSHRYLGKYTADGTMTVCQLDDTDSTLYADGSAATLTGEEGDVFMKLPKFYYIARERQTDVWSIGFYYGDSAPSSAWKEWDGNDLIGAYEATYSSKKLYSVSGKYIGFKSQEGYKEWARARGNGYSLIKWKHHCIMAFLYYAMYGNMNCQSTIGSGTTSEDATGYRNNFGMEDYGVGIINFWGLENWWAQRNRNTLLDNVLVSVSWPQAKWEITEDDGSVREVNGSYSADFVLKMVIGEHLDLIPSERQTGSATTGYCDKVYHKNNADGLVVAKYDYYAEGGVAGLYINYTPSDSNNFLGSRLAFRGNIIINNDSTAFKALTAIG